jgi:hypothetical protein
MPVDEMRQTLHTLEDTFASAVQALQERHIGGATAPQRRPMTASAVAPCRPQSARPSQLDSEERRRDARHDEAPEGVVGVRLHNQRGTVRPVRPSTAPSQHGAPRSLPAAVVSPAEGTAAATTVPSRPTSSRPPSGKLRRAPSPSARHSPAKAMMMMSAQRQEDDSEANIVTDDGADVDAAVEHQWTTAASKKSVMSDAVGPGCGRTAAVSKREARRLLREEMERRERTTDGTAMITVVRDNTSALTAIALGLKGVDVPVAEQRNAAATPREAPPAAAPPSVESYFSNFHYTSIDQYLAAQKRSVLSYYGNRISAVLDVHRQLQDAGRPELPTPAEFGERQRMEALERKRQAELKDPRSKASKEEIRVNQANHAVRLVQPLQATVTARRVRSALSRRPGTHKF